MEGKNLKEIVKCSFIHDFKFIYFYLKFEYFG